MSGLELVAVVACVAAVVSAYQDGTELVKKYKAKRRARRALESQEETTQELELSLCRGERTVQDQYDRDYRRFGQSFSEGDAVAREELKDIIIMLQNQMIVNLKVAWATDASVNFDNLQDTSDTGQDRAMMCLLQLQQRILVKKPIPRLVGHPTSSERIVPPMTPPAREDTWPSQASTVPDHYAKQSNTSRAEGPSSLGSQPSLSPPRPDRAYTYEREEPRRGGILTSLAFKLQRSKAPSQMSSRIVDLSDDGPKSWIGNSPPAQWTYNSTPDQSSMLGQSSPYGPPTMADSESNPAAVVNALSRDRFAANVSTHDHVGLGIMPKPPPTASSNDNNPSDHLHFNPWGETRPHETPAEVPSTTSYFAPQPENPPPNPRANVTPPQPALLSPSTLPSPPPSQHSTTSQKASSSRTSKTFSIFRSRTNSSLEASHPTPKTSPPASLFHRSSTHSDTLDYTQPITPPTITQTLTSPLSSPPPSSTTTTTTTTTTDFLPRPSNNFAGFCKGAYALQTGAPRSAMHERARPAAASLTQSVPYWKCTRCAFEGRMARGGGGGARGGGEKSIDTTVYSCEGVPYRWQFLFKSHVQQKGERSLTDANLACLFCCAEGRGTVTYGGLKSFFGHLKEHGARLPDNGEVVDRVKVIRGRLARPEEDFDVNLIEA